MSEAWFYTEGGRQRGPVSIGALQQRRAAGTLLATDLVWRKGMSEWQPAERLPVLGFAGATGTDAGAVKPTAEAVPSAAAVEPLPCRSLGGSSDVMLTARAAEMLRQT